jgi:hypothetical protein
VTKRALEPYLTDVDLVTERDRLIGRLLVAIPVRAKRKVNQREKGEETECRRYGQ